MIARGTAVPEAAVDEDGELAADKCDVRAACDVFAMKPITAHAGSPEGLAKRELGFGILCAVGAHHP